ncbi:MAG: DUF2484 family protein [Tateyamaria sp.]
MSLSLVFACLWAVAANVIAMLPSRDNHWSYAYGLIAVGIPIVGYVTWQHGPWIGLLIMVAGMSILRWPVIYLSRWIKGRITR